MHSRLSGWSGPERGHSSRRLFAALAKLSSVRLTGFAVGRDQFSVGEVILLSGKSVFDVTNRARQTLNKGGDTIVAFTPRPVGRFTGKSRRRFSISTLHSLWTGSW